MDRAGSEARAGPAPTDCGEEDAIVAAIQRALAQTHELIGERVLITAGPTREPIDPVRFLSNASTGTMGIELAREAGAEKVYFASAAPPTLSVWPSMRT